MSVEAAATGNVKKTHVSHPSLKLLEELAGGKKMAEFWEAISRDPELVYYQRPKKAKRIRKRKKKVKKREIKLKTADTSRREEGKEREAANTTSLQVPKEEEEDSRYSLPSVEHIASLEPTPPPENDETCDAPPDTESTVIDKGEMQSQGGTRGSVDLTEAKIDDIPFRSAVKLPIEPSFQDVFFPTVDTHIREFSFIDLDEMVAQLQDEVRNEELGETPKESDMIENLALDDDVTEMEEKTLELVMPSPVGKEKSTEYTVTWEKRPLGIEVVRGPGGLNAWVRRVVDDKLEGKIVPGSFITHVNGQLVLGESYSRILKIIGRIKDKVTLVLNENPKLEKMIPVGSMIRLTNLSRETALNGCVGFIFSEMVDGRYPIKLAEFGDQIGVKPKNIIVLEEAGPAQMESDSQETFDFSGTYELVKTIGMSKFLRSQGMSWFKTKLRSNPKLSMTIDQNGTTFKMVFSSPMGALTDEFIANKSSFRGRTWKGSVTDDKDKQDVAYKSAVIIGQRLEITEVTKLGEKKKIVFFQGSPDIMVLEVVNNKGAQMVQEFRRTVKKK